MHQNFSPQGLGTLFDAEFKVSRMLQPLESLEILDIEEFTSTGDSPFSLRDVYNMT